MKALSDQFRAPAHSRVSLEVPADHRSAKLVRLAVADAAARCGLGVSEVDALSAAAGELCVTLLRSAIGRALVRVDVDHRPGCVEVTVRSDGVPPLQLRSGRSP